jgi:hypothetical protein
MTHWTLAQALTWAMWRDESRVAKTGDDGVDALLARPTAEDPTMSDQDRAKVIQDLLEHGEACLILSSPDEPARERERRWMLHEPSGCGVALEGWRERSDAPLCVDGALHWRLPREEPVLGYAEADTELLIALRDGRVIASREDGPGSSRELRPNSALTIFSFRRAALAGR